MNGSIVGGTIKFKINGQIRSAKGDFSYSLGAPKREAVVGSDGIHGYKETPQVGYIEGEITDSPELVLEDLVSARDASIELTLANGKIISLTSAYYAGDGVGNTGEGNIGVRFEGKCREIV